MVKNIIIAVLLVALCLTTWEWKRTRIIQIPLSFALTNGQYKSVEVSSGEVIIYNMPCEADYPFIQDAILYRVVKN